jgi:NAD-dependent DNA ligase
MKETKEFIELQKDLLIHKKLYYIDDSPIISDYDYDMLEKKSFKLAKEIGFRADKWEDAEDNEKHHIHWMVGFDKNSIYW